MLFAVNNTYAISDFVVSDTGVFYAWIFLETAMKDIDLTQVLGMDASVQAGKLFRYASELGVAEAGIAERYINIRHHIARYHADEKSAFFMLKPIVAAGHVVSFYDEYRGGNIVINNLQDKSRFVLNCNQFFGRWAIYNDAKVLLIASSVDAPRVFNHVIALNLENRTLETIYIARNAQVFDVLVIDGGVHMLCFVPNDNGAVEFESIRWIPVDGETSIYDISFLPKGCDFVYSFFDAGLAVYAYDENGGQFSVIDLCGRTVLEKNVFAGNGIYAIGAGDGALFAVHEYNSMIVQLYYFNVADNGYDWAADLPEDAVYVKNIKIYAGMAFVNCADRLYRLNLKTSAYEVVFESESGEIESFMLLDDLLMVAVMVFDRRKEIGAVKIFEVKL